ncbi:MAG: hypothetical protein GYA24_23220 [Candidatus Lokiarchaeota archaeon]|nr:hypothetical protein [Candidatus Lokiarchaeota archaeon]
MKCTICGKTTDITCARCQKGACASHARIYHRQFFCHACFPAERRKGLVYTWLAFGALAAMAMVALIMLSR